MNSTPGATQFVVADWFKSSYSAANNECVEVTHTQSRVGIRDSKALIQGVVTMGADAFAIFVNGVKAGSDACTR